MAYINPGSKKQKEGFGSVGSIVGGGVGAVVGGLVSSENPGSGALSGFNAGTNIGGSLGSVAKPTDPGGATGGMGPMERKMATFNTAQAATEESAVLRDSLRALETAPKEIQTAYMDPIMEAYRRSLSRGVA